MTTDDLNEILPRGEDFVSGEPAIQRETKSVIKDVMLAEHSSDGKHQLPVQESSIDISDSVEGQVQFFHDEKLMLLGDRVFPIGVEKTIMVPVLIAMPAQIGVNAYLTQYGNADRPDLASGTFSHIYKASSGTTLYSSRHIASATLARGVYNVRAKMLYTQLTSGISGGKAYIRCDSDVNSGGFPNLNFSLGHEGELEEAVWPAYAEMEFPVTEVDIKYPQCQMRSVVLKAGHIGIACAIHLERIR